MLKRIACALGVLTCTLLLGMPANATVTLDGEAHSGQNHVYHTSLTADLTTSQAGDFVLVWVAADGFDSDPAMSISGGGITWTESAELAVPNQFGDDIDFYLFTGTATSQLTSAGITITTGQSPTEIKMSLLIQAYSGCSGIDQLVTATSGTSVGLTTGAANTLAVGGMLDMDSYNEFSYAGTGYIFDSNDWSNFLQDDEEVMQDERASSITANSGTNVTVDWAPHTGDSLVMIATSLAP